MSKLCILCSYHLDGHLFEKNVKCQKKKNEIENLLFEENYDKLGHKLLWFK